MRFTRHEIANATGALLHGQDGLVVGATIDSRDVSPGALFVPIRAERDGHDFIEAARHAGAGAWFTSRPLILDNPEPVAVDGALFVVDTTAALQLLGSYARGRLPDRVIGVTGSSGKTSTKDLIGAILRAAGPAAVSEKSFNNELGVPLTLVNAPDDARHAVVEMGARGIGHIAMLCGIARPTVGVVTNIGTAHRDLFGSA
jgi:UDP-N-acetylmuramoyl-tripeptide--D-alanyl-D-alanine ligase